MRRFILTAALVVIVGCGSSDRDRVPRGRLIPAGQIGAIDGPVSLGQVLGITLSHGAGDTLLVTQFQVPSVLLLSSAGDSIGAIGRGGSGPGELTGPGLAVSVHQDTLWVLDSNGIVTRYTWTGDFIDQLRIPTLPAYAIRPAFVRALSDGTLLVEAGRSAATEGEEASAYIRLSRAFEVLDTVALVTRRGSSYRLDLGAVHLVGSHPVDHSDRVAVDPLGRWLVTARWESEGTEAFLVRFSWIVPSGDTVRVREMRFAARSAEAERERFIDRVSFGHEGFPRAQMARSVREQIAWPRWLPPVLDLVPGNDGRTWIRMPHEVPDSSSWLLLDGAGHAIGVFALAEHVQLMAAAGSSVWASARGAYDEPYVLRFEVDR